jgi:APA family basic amino acid/polyamine antiporter
MCCNVSCRYPLFVALSQVLNIAVILFIIILGSFHVTPHFWTDAIPAGTPAPAGCGSGGGVLPCGFNGVLGGAAKVFFAYIGFDSVTTLGMCCVRCV